MVAEVTQHCCDDFCKIQRPPTSAVLCILCIQLSERNKKYKYGVTEGTLLHSCGDWHYNCVTTQPLRIELTAKTACPALFNFGECFTARIFGLEGGLLCRCRPGTSDDVVVLILIISVGRCFPLGLGLPGPTSRFSPNPMSTTSRRPVSLCPPRLFTSRQIWIHARLLCLPTTSLPTQPTSASDRQTRFPFASPHQFVLLSLPPQPRAQARSPPRSPKHPALLPAISCRPVFPSPPSLDGTQSPRICMLLCLPSTVGAGPTWTGHLRHTDNLLIPSQAYLRIWFISPPFLEDLRFFRTTLLIITRSADSFIRTPIIPQVVGLSFVSRG
ncbi:unnamed protein product [Protopolystoma xenopodis]|uniref:Uncharacterized protein n=1 Tax=Protopolystoma xenopodis TaxID=117903 RepID=A0A3S5FGG5_9PLAT|nr:unnamed protein product [Protopolystoma xenopodis]